MSTIPFLRPLTCGAAAAVAAVAVFGLAAPASAETTVAEPSTFTSAFTVMATPDQVVNPDGVFTPGEAGATGEFNFRVNSDLDIICYDITLTNVTGDYQSPAKTATHVHEAELGKPGPPRIAFPNPAPVGDGPRTSSGCLQGPFTTGVVVNGADTGAGFTLKALEANAAGFAGDSHTVNSPAGVVRGQLSQMPVGGLQTGGGATAAAADGGSQTSAVLTVGAGAAVVLGLGGFALYRRRSVQPEPTPSR
ncbi:CHRD domain-containing protein [Cryobacterium melibiosiphilum]|uniref:CHRD domain-containing protein n=1 Tax=Cryobacterium melibiosiphilum TaxID=995039 RepID=A0A3A5MF72_9MICO|nr:CHRD domain-containing protein [Cryobacterium melibiosiphilum]RJT85743.1 CHRD domain-containing protein [Cryobacterium melibiosiphilum]